jgi:hypothetical protein
MDKRNNTKGKVNFSLHTQNDLKVPRTYLDSGVKWLAMETVIEVMNQTDSLEELREFSDSFKKIIDSDCIKMFYKELDKE